MCIFGLMTLWVWGLREYSAFFFLFIGVFRAVLNTKIFVCECYVVGDNRSSWVRSFWPLYQKRTKMELFSF